MVVAAPSLPAEDVAITGVANATPIYFRGDDRDLARELVCAIGHGVPCAAAAPVAQWIERPPPVEMGTRAATRGVNVLKVGETPAY